MQPYPEGFPLEALTIMARAVKDQDFSDRANLFLASYNVLGACLREYAGEGDAGPGPPRGGGRKQLNEQREAKAILEYCEQAQAQADQIRARGAAPPREAERGAFPVPWGLVLQLALQVIQKLVQKKKVA